MEKSESASQVYLSWEGRAYCEVIVQSMADEDFVVDDLLDPLSNGMEAWCTDEMFPLDTLLGISAASHRPLRFFQLTETQVL